MSHNIAVRTDREQRALVETFYKSLVSPDNHVSFLDYETEILRAYSNVNVEDLYEGFIGYSWIGGHDIHDISSVQVLSKTFILIWHHKNSGLACHFLLQHAKSNPDHVRYLYYLSIWCSDLTLNQKIAYLEYGIKFNFLPSKVEFVLISCESTEFSDKMIPFFKEVIDHIVDSEDSTYKMMIVYYSRLVMGCLPDYLIKLDELNYLMSKLDYCESVGWFSRDFIRFYKGQLYSIIALYYYNKGYNLVSTGSRISVDDIPKTVDYCKLVHHYLNRLGLGCADPVAYYQVGSFIGYDNVLTGCQYITRAIVHASRGIQLLSTEDHSLLRRHQKLANLSCMKRKEWLEQFIHKINKEYAGDLILIYQELKAIQEGSNAGDEGIKVIVDHLISALRAKTPIVSNYISKVANASQISELTRTCTICSNDALHLPMDGCGHFVCVDCYSRCPTKCPYCQTRVNPKSSVS